MAKLIYAAITSLDGYVEDAEGRFDWAAPVRGWSTSATSSCARSWWEARRATRPAA